MNCEICAASCHLTEHQPGRCGQYVLDVDENSGRQEIRELHPDRYLVACPISIETMPMMHYFPGGKFLQISTTGCNFDCPGCVSTVIVREMDPSSPALRHMTPEQVVSLALDNDCLGIAFLMNDPLASLPTFLRVARAARRNHLKVGCSSNGYFSDTSLTELMPLLDFINIGIKGLDDSAYRRCGAPSAAPVLDNIRRMMDYGIHVEVSCMMDQDNAPVIMDLAARLAGISPGIPLQVMRFIPLEQADPGLEASILAAERLCMDLNHILKHVYLFNSPGTNLLNSCCPDCGRLIYRRDFYGPMGAKICHDDNDLHQGETCPDCGCDLNLRGSGPRPLYVEGPFQGGYPFTRALEMIEAILLAMGVCDKKSVMAVWEDILINDRLAALHHDIQKLPTYLKTVRYCAEIAGCQAEGERLAGYLESRIELVKETSRHFHRDQKNLHDSPDEDLTQSLVSPEVPRVYYAMGTPLFAIKGERMENQLVEAAGGRSVNREMPIDGRPGQSISAERLNALNPDVIFISGFISCTVEDFYEICRRENIDVNALRNGQVHVHPGAGWDFGSPRWILGLMYISSILFPKYADFDVMNEAQLFYREFYGLDFVPESVNRSFGKPDIRWAWNSQV